VGVDNTLPWFGEIVFYVVGDNGTDIVDL